MSKDQRFYNSDAEVTDINELKEKIADLEKMLSMEKSKNLGFETALNEANNRIAELQSCLSDLNTDKSELEELKEQERSSKVEYEGLKDLYHRKVKDFNDGIEEKEQAFAREDAIKRYDLEKEIQKSKEENQASIESTLKEFSDSFDYYLGHIRILMDTIIDSAVQSGQDLFGENHSDATYKSIIGEKITEVLQNIHADLNIDAEEQPAGDGEVSENSAPAESAEETQPEG